MAFIIESNQNQALIHVNMMMPVEKADGLRMKISLGQLLAARKKSKTVFLALDLSIASGQDNLPLVQLLSHFSDIYHQWRKEFQLELLLVLDPALMGVARYVAESLFVPILFFASTDALEVYVDRRTGDTQPIRPEWARSLKTPINTED